MNRKLENGYVHCIQTFFTILYVVGNFIVFTDLASEIRDVNENILATIVRCNETKSFSFIEKFYCTFLHCK